MKIRTFLTAVAVAVLAPTAAFASTATPDPSPAGGDVSILWTNDTAPCAEYLTSLNAGTPGSYYGTGIKWPDGTYTHVPLPQTNPVAVTVPAGMIAGTAYIFLAKDPNAVPVESSLLGGCEMKIEVVAPLPSPMISAESIVVGAALVALVGGGLMTSRRRRFAQVAG